MYKMLRADHRLVNRGDREYQVSIKGKQYKVIILYSPSPRANRFNRERRAQYKKIFGIPAMENAASGTIFSES